MNADKRTVILGNTCVLRVGDPRGKNGMLGM